MFALILIAFLSCDKKDRYYPYNSWTMEIKNNSNHLVRLEFFSISHPIYNVDTTLSNNLNYVLSLGDNDAVGGGLDYINSGVFDSAIIVFDGNTHLIYTHNKTTGVMNDSARNILYTANYSLIESTANKEVFQYSIEESDYQISGKEKLKK